MINIRDNIISFFGSEEMKKIQFNKLNPEDRFSYICQFIDAMKEYSGKFKEVKSDELASNLLKTMTEEELYSFVYNMRDYAYFMSNKQGIDRYFSATANLLENEGKTSVKKAYESFYEDKSTLQDAISVSLAQCLRLMLIYKIPLIQELFDRLCDNNNFVTDKRLVAIVSNIKSSAWHVDEFFKKMVEFGYEDNMDSDKYKEIMDAVKHTKRDIQDVANSRVVRLIRNGIAHFSFQDNSPTADCMDVDKLLSSMIVKIDSKDGKEFITLDFKAIRAIIDIMKPYIDSAKYDFNDIRIDEYALPLSAQNQIVFNKFKEFKNYAGLEPFEKEFLDFQLRENTKNALTFKGFTELKSAIKSPQMTLVPEIDKAIDMIISLNSGRNKGKNDAMKILKTLPILSIAVLTQNISRLKEMGLLKEFVNANMDNPTFKGISLFKFDTNPKKKSVINKLRLLRNCLEHGWLLNYGNAFYAYDVDEKGAKIDLGLIPFEEVVELCDLIEDYIKAYYENMFETTKNSAFKPEDVM